jgi:superfamily II DNA or RNA helicase
VPLRQLFFREHHRDEMKFRFHLDFWALTRELIESTVSGNPFVDHPLMIARLDQLKNDDELKAKLERSDWDLIVCDEAHKMSASYFGGEIK